MIPPQQGISLKQSQTLTITPEIQHSLKVLQCNRQELEQEIARMLDENIMLERLDSNEEFQLTDSFDDDYQTLESLSDDIPDIIDCDVAWEDICDAPEDYDKGVGGDIDGFQEDWISDGISFDERLESSLQLCELSAEEKQLATSVLSYLDDHYFLTLPIEKLARKLKTTTPIMRHIIDVIKHLDPPGVASQSIQECMLAQLHSLPIFDDSIGDANDILSDYFSYIGEKNELIKQRLGLTDREFQQAIRLIRTLSPYPCSEDSNQGRPITPEVYVHQRMGMFYASLNKDARYDIGINEDYAAMTSACQGDEKNFMQAQLKMAKFFMRALDQRHQTILRVANAIVMEQQDYFSDGDKALKPMIMKDLADVLGLAESTISRTVNGKYLSFNQRLIELRYFFSNEVTKNTMTDEDSEVANSAIAVKALMKEIIENEPPRKPLSDAKIEQELQLQGIDIARRTIAKYREAIGIPPASKRKRRN
ncbi:MAG: RNA polymerase factor sigma-54 [Gammaproteobacteria bacterium]|nr:RNA polymerase factor sigma-54 [Gammaproteobacteria bacterium]